MKFRFGFVSNSSSMSFIVRVSEKFPNVFALAKEMIKLRGWDDDDKLVQSIMSAGKNRDTNICFSTCNYDTFIMRDGDHLLVDTCNNHGLWEEIEKFYPEWFHAVRDKNDNVKFSGRDWDPDSGFRFDYLDDIDWWLPHLRIAAQRPKGKDGYGFYERCDDCFTRLWLIDGEIKCPHCDKTYKQVLKDKEKKRKKK